MSTATSKVSVRALRTFAVAALEAVGMSAVDAATTADVLVETDAMGVFTHGTKLLRDYVRRARAGGIRVDARPEILRQGPAWAMIDGASAMGQVAASFGMRTAISKAKSTGVGYVGLRNTNHFGAAGYYACLAARAGLIGIAMANDIPSVAAPGSRRAVLGSNPLAYGVPTSGEPILLDMATSSVAGGKVYAAHQRGEPIPDNWIIGPDGLPTTDGSLYPANAALAPMGGHKGYGIALLIETLSGVLTGSSITWQVGNWIWGDATKPTDHGAAFLAIDIESIA
jgi:ureidoglycolate dehydrogenase (NAD+)